MTTTRELIDRIRREFLGSRTEQINKLATDLTTDTLSLAYELKGIGEGARLSVDLEDMYVWSVNPTAKSATVQRGFESSTAVFHPADSIVRVSPRITDSEILIAINNTIRGLYGDGIFCMGTTELQFTPTKSTYELPDDALNVYRVHTRDPAEPDGWLRLYGWIFDRNQSITDYPSGLTMTFTREVPPSGFRFRVTYRQRLGTLSTLTEVVETVTGLDTATDLIKLGAAIRLTSGRESARNISDAQGSTRRAQEVPPGAELGGNRALQQQYERELMRVRSALTRLYPSESGI